MRNNIVHPGADELTYEIREIVAVAHEIETMGQTIYWENIGDPVAKGREVAPWVKEVVTDTVQNDNTSYGYSPTKGVLATREFIAEMRNKEGGAQITPDDILFFNGLGDAISTMYTYLNQNSRVIGPNPAYSTHSSAEAAHAKDRHITYRLNPYRNWLPDLEELRNKVKYNPSIAGILIINPDNPTGMVYPRKVLEQIVEIAREFDLFIVSDEIYSNIVFGQEVMTTLASVLDGVPGIAMKGLSKEIPWPGARCGWIEVYNKDADPNFARYIKTLNDAKMLEVCSTTLPQTVLPKLYMHKEYDGNLKSLAGCYAKRADIAYEALHSVDGIVAPKAQGAFYTSVVFDEGVLRDDQTLTIENEQVRTYIEGAVRGVSQDKRFVYYLMAATGICVVPLSGMNSDLQGFRLTLLEPDEQKFAGLMKTLAEHITKYLHS